MPTIVILPYRNYYSLMLTVGLPGIRVIEAYDTSDILRLTVRWSPELVIIPDDAEPVDGEELLTAIRGLTRAAIIVVGAGGETEMANALLQGADSYLQHPDEARKLRSVIPALLRRTAVGDQPGRTDE